jgi:hypothetical protein
LGVSLIPSAFVNHDHDLEVSRADTLRNACKNSGECKTRDRVSKTVCSMLTSYEKPYDITIWITHDDPNGLVAQRSRRANVSNTGSCENPG